MMSKLKVGLIVFGATLLALSFALSPAPSSAQDFTSLCSTNILDNTPDVGEALDLFCNSASTDAVITGTVATDVEHSTADTVEIIWGSTMDAEVTLPVGENATTDAAVAAESNSEAIADLP
jgi:hypothetical protein